MSSALRDRRQRPQQERRHHRQRSPARIGRDRRDGRLVHQSQETSDWLLRSTGKQIKRLNVKHNLASFTSGDNVNCVIAAQQKRVFFGCSGEIMPEIEQT